MADVLFVFGMHIVSLADIDGYGHPRVRQPKRDELSLAHLRPLALTWSFVRGKNICQLNPKEWQIEPLPLISPIVDQGRKEFAILMTAIVVRLALVPNNTTYRVPQKGGYRAIPQSGGAMNGTRI